MTPKMRVLTVRQPWAWAIIHGGKDVENRVRNIAGVNRGPVAIHVAGKYATEGLDLDALNEACDEWCAIHGCDRHPWFAGVGKIIGVVDLDGAHHSDSCYDDDKHRLVDLYRKNPKEVMAIPDTGSGGLIGRIRMCSPWALDDVWHLSLKDPRALSDPIPFRGALGMRYLSDEVTEQINAQIAVIS